MLCLSPVPLTGICKINLTGSAKSTFFFFWKDSFINSRTSYEIAKTRTWPQKSPRPSPHFKLAVNALYKATASMLAYICSKLRDIFTHHCVEFTYHMLTLMGIAQGVVTPLTICEAIDLFSVPLGCRNLSTVLHSQPVCISAKSFQPHR